MGFCATSAFRRNATHDGSATACRVDVLLPPLKGPIAAEPLADGGDGGGEPAGSRLDPALAGRFDQAQAMIVGVSPLTNQIEVGGAHGGQILPAARRPALPPAGRPAPAASSHSYTTTSPGGYDVSRLSQTKLTFDLSLARRYDGAGYPATKVTADSKMASLEQTSLE